MNIKNYLNNEFFKNILTLMTGTILGQIISLGSLLYISRIFSITDFAIFNTFVAVSSILSVISALRFEVTIILPKNNNNAYNLTILSILFTFVTSAIIMLSIILFKENIFDALKLIYPKADSDALNYILLLPIYIFITGFYQIQHFWMTRFKNFKILSKGKIIQSVITAAVTITLGLIYNSPSGLIIGAISGLTINSCFVFFFFIKEVRKSFYSISLDILKEEFKNNLNFLYFSMPMGLLNSITVNILVLSLNIVASPKIVGLYSYANKNINLPLSLISNSFMSVFYQKLNSTKEKVKLYKRSFYSNLLIASAVMFPIFIAGEFIFKVAFGDKWEEAGSIARILIPITVSGFALRCVSSVYAVTKRNEITLIWQIIFLLGSLGIIFFINKNTDYLFTAFSLFGTLMYFTSFKLGLNSLKKHEIKINE